LQIIPVTQPHLIHGLHLGETETLQLALERKADAVLMDERDGRTAAQRLRIPAIYTLAILELAAQKNLVDLEPALLKLKQTSFFIAPQILTGLLDRHRQRQK
jgi:predicted nucleic acid-binding protein